MNGWPDKIAISLMVLAAIGLGLRSMAPTITAGDSAELSAAQATLGIAHSPGYPLFVLAGKSFSSLMPFGHAAYKTNLFSLFCAGGAAAALWVFLRGAGGTFIISVLSVLSFLLIPSVRGQFLTTEVFALNCLWAIVLLCVLSRAVSSGQVRLYVLSAFLFGLSLGNQHTLILLLPGFAAVLLPVMLNGTVKPAQLLTLGFAAALGASIYLYVPLRSLRNPLLDWEDPQTFERFWNVATRARYGTFQLAQGAGSTLDLASLYQGALFFARLAWKELGLILTAVTLWGAYAALRDKANRTFCAFLALSVLFSGPLFFSLTQGWKLANPEVVLRFLPLPLTVLFAWGALGLARLRRVPVGAALLLAAFCLLFAKRDSAAGQWWLYDHGRAIFQTLPPNALLFMDRADETEFSAAYLHYAEGIRKDVQIVDCNAGVTKSIYGDDYYEVWGKPRLERRERIESELIRASARPVFYATVEPEMVSSIAKRRRGLLFDASGTEGAHGDWDEYYALRGSLRDPGFRGAGLMSSYHELMGNYYLGLGGGAKAAIHLGLWADSVPGRSLYHQAALSAYRHGAFDMADGFFARAFEREPEKDKILCNWGLALEQTGRDGGAEQKYLKAAELNISAAEPHYKLGALYWKQRKWKNVVDEFEKVLERDPRHPDAGRFLQLARSKQRG